MSFKDLSKFTPQEFKEFLDSFDTILTDCDGVLWITNNAIKGAPEVINKLKAMGKQIFYVTNNSTKIRDEFLEKFSQLGFNVVKEEIISTAYLTAVYLKSLGFKKKVFVVGSVGITKELDNVGIRHIGVGPDPITADPPTFLSNLKLDPDVGAVVVGFDPHFSLPKMMKAVNYLEREGTLFIGTNADQRFPHEPLVMPGTGSFVAAIQTSSLRTPVIIGKPEAFISEYLMKEHKIIPNRTIMIGDNSSTDVLLGKRCGFKTLLVLTGVTKFEEVRKWKEDSVNDLVPDYFTEKIEDLLVHL